MSDVAHAFLDTDPDGKTIIRAINTESHSGHTLVPVLVSRRTVVRLADQLGLIILDPELIQEGDRGEDHRPRLHPHLVGSAMARKRSAWERTWRGLERPTVPVCMRPILLLGRCHCPGQRVGQAYHGPGGCGAARRTWMSLTDATSRHSGWKVPTYA
jgi:hypothetical protein